MQNLSDQTPEQYRDGNSLPPEHVHRLQFSFPHAIYATYTRYRLTFTSTSAATVVAADATTITITIFAHNKELQDFSCIFKSFPTEFIVNNVQPCSGSSFPHSRSSEKHEQEH